MPDFHLTAGQNHMLTHFITEEKWKFEKAREIKKAQYRKEKLLKKNVVRMTPEELLQASLKFKPSARILMPIMLIGKEPRSDSSTRRRNSPMLEPQRNMKFLRLKSQLSRLKNMPAPLMMFRLLMKMLVPGLMIPFQPLKKLPGHPLAVRLKKLKKSGQLHQLRLKKINQIPQLHLHLHQLQFFHVHLM